MARKALNAEELQYSGMGDGVYICSGLQCPFRSGGEKVHCRWEKRNTLKLVESLSFSSAMCQFYNHTQLCVTDLTVFKVGNENKGCCF